jgi:hypothetical protein
MTAGLSQSDSVETGENELIHQHSLAEQVVTANTRQSSSKYRPAGHVLRAN